MAFNKTRLLAFSVVLNIVLIGGGVFFVVKRNRFQYRLDHPAVLPSYLKNAQYAEQVNIHPAYTRPEKIVLLGNSHIYKAHWDELLNRGDIGNRGIGSDITEGYLHRLQYVLNSHPQICFVEGGVNDVELHIPADTTIANLTKILDTLSQAHIIPVLHTVIHVAETYPSSDYFKDRITRLNKRIVELAASRHIDCIDLNPTLAPDGVLLPKYAQGDGVHLTGEAYLVWKDAIEKILGKYHI